MEHKVVRMYSLNQEKIDEALQGMVDFILKVASDKKLRDIEAQLRALWQVKEGK